MWTPRIVIGSQEVLAHGSVLSNGNQPIDLYPLPVPFNSYLVRLIFEQKRDEAASIRFGSATSSMFLVTLINFDAAIVTGHPAPIYVANHMGRKVMLSVASSYVGPSHTGTRVVTYTFLDGGPS